MEALAEAVLSKAPEEFTLVGLSMGGYVAFEIMRQAPERVARLVLMDTTARPDTPEARRRRRGLIDLTRRGNFKGVTPRLLPLLIAPAHLENESLIQAIMAMGERVGPDVFVRQQTAIMNRIDSRPFLKDIRAPTLVMCGAEDALTPPEHAQEIVDGIGPNAQLQIIEDSGHLAPLEQPEAVTRLLKEWLRPRTCDKSVFMA